MVQRTAQMKNMESEHVTVFSKILEMKHNYIQYWKQWIGINSDSSFCHWWCFLLEMNKWGTFSKACRFQLLLRSTLKFRQTATKADDVIVLALLLGSYLMSTFNLYNYLLKPQAHHLLNILLHPYWRLSKTHCKENAFHSRMRDCVYKHYIVNAKQHNILCFHHGILMIIQQNKVKTATKVSKNY